jgi:hypothetical protein
MPTHNPPKAEQRKMQHHNNPNLPAPEEVVMDRNRLCDELGEALKRLPPAQIAHIGNTIIGWVGNGTITQINNDEFSIRKSR